MSTPTFLSKTLDWFIRELDTLVKEETSFEINSFVRVFSAQDSFNEEFTKDQKVNYPFISYQTKNASLAVDRLGSMMTRKKSYPLSNVTFNSSPKPNDIDYVTDTTGQRIKQATIWPIDIELSISFFTNTPQQYEEFLLAWISIHPVISELIIFTDSITLPVTAIPTVEAIDYPDKENDDRGEFYRGEFTARIQTFSGRIGELAAIKKQKLEDGSITPITSKILTDSKGNALGNIIKISST